MFFIISKSTNCNNTIKFPFRLNFFYFNWWIQNFQFFASHPVHDTFCKNTVAEYFYDYYERANYSSLNHGASNELGADHFDQRMLDGRLGHVFCIGQPAEIDHSVKSIGAVNPTGEVLDHLDDFSAVMRRIFADSAAFMSSLSS